MSNVRQSFSAFVLNNQRNLYWLYTASILIMIANWFVPTHGFFEFEQPLLRGLLLNLSLLTPAAGVFALSKGNCRNFVPQIAVFVFVSMLFQWYFATLTCFVVLVYAWTKPNNAVAILILFSLQIGALLFFFSESISPRLYSNLSSISMPMSERTVILQQDRKGSESLPNCDYSVNSFFDVAGGLRLVKTYFSFYDEYGDYNPKGFSLEAAKNLSDSIYFVSDQDSNPPIKVLVNLKHINDKVSYHIRANENLSPSSP